MKSRVIWSAALVPLMVRMSPTTTAPACAGVAWVCPPASVALATKAVAATAAAARPFLCTFMVCSFRQWVGLCRPRRFYGDCSPGFPGNRSATACVGQPVGLSAASSEAAACARKRRDTGTERWASVTTVAMDDAGLASRFASGDADSVRVVYQTYGRLVFSIAYKVLGDTGLAEDATQQTFVQAWRAAPRTTRAAPWGPGSPRSPSASPSTSTGASGGIATSSTSTRPTALAWSRCRRRSTS